MATPGQLLQWIVVSLLGVAVVMVHSAGMTVDGQPLAADALLWDRPTFYALIAVGVMFVAGYVDVRRLADPRPLRNPILWLIVGSTVLCALVLVPGIGRSVNGASRWLYLGPASWGLSFQPSELAKWAVVAGIAWWGARRAGGMANFSTGLLPALAVLGLICALIIVEDLGTAVLIGAVGLIMLWATGARWWHLAMLAPPGIAAVAGLIFTSPYRIRRLTAFLEPWADPLGMGYHPIQSLTAIAGGNLTGRGLGNGLQKFGYLPEDTTDFLFAIICEELGVAGAALVIGMYLALLWVGLGIIRDSRHTFARLLGLGILAMIGLQAAINLAVVTVVVPTKGIALPLLSYGGTGWIACAGAIGLLVAIDRLNRLEAAAPAGETGPATLHTTPGNTTAPPRRSPTSHNGHAAPSPPRPASTGSAVPDEFDAEEEPHDAAPQHDPPGEDSDYEYEEEAEPQPNPQPESAPAPLSVSATSTGGSPAEPEVVVNPGLNPPPPSATKHA